MFSGQKAQSTSRNPGATLTRLPLPSLVYECASIFPIANTAVQTPPLRFPELLSALATPSRLECHLNLSLTLFPTHCTFSLLKLGLYYWQPIETVVVESTRTHTLITAHGAPFCLIFLQQGPASEMFPFIRTLQPWPSWQLYPIYFRNGFLISLFLLSIVPQYVSCNLAPQHFCLNVSSPFLFSLLNFVYISPSIAFLFRSL